MASKIAQGALLAVSLAVPAAWAQTPATDDIALTRHNLSTSGRGAIRASSESRICVFCHTPHNAAPLSPLWNKELQPQTYTVYSSPTLKSGPLQQPTGPTKLCLSCHDGTIAMGNVLNPSGGITMIGGDVIPPGSHAEFGLDLSGHHPVSFPYSAALPNDKLAATPPHDLTFGGTDEVHCTTCHDPHRDPYGKFLVKDNRSSALCVTCHRFPDWATSAHATSTASVEGVLPRPPKTWPTYTQLGEWGCETCHTAHFAPTAEQLLNFTSDPPDPFSCTSAGCHGSDPGGGEHGLLPSSTAPAAGTQRRGADIAGQVRKLSAHREQIDMRGMPSVGTGKAARAASGVVACADCHNPHVANDRNAEAPYASGRLEGMSGVDRNGAEVTKATYEYEVCFKCHGDYNRIPSYVPRVVETSNLRQAFDPSNASFHPVVAMGRNPEVPSIPSSFEPSMTPTTMLYCTSCHADDEGGSRGPHGSAFAPILTRRYELGDNTPESLDNYALCYRCHDRTRLMADTSFGKKLLHGPATNGGGHSGHLAAGASCATCHDPHGVPATGPANSGSHTHLVNFDRRIVTATGGNQYPIFRDGGGFTGSCTLVCHGVVHDGSSYP